MVKRGAVAIAAGIVRRTLDVLETEDLRKYIILDHYITHDIPPCAQTRLSYSSDEPRSIFLKFEIGKRQAGARYMPRGEVPDSISCAERFAIFWQ